MIIAAMMSGTYSRVSCGRYLLVADRRQKSSTPDRLIARETRPGPPLYAARTRLQSPLNMRLRVFRYFAAATVAFSGSDRSSMNQSVLSPCSFAVGFMNCHGPFALAFDRALVLNELSMIGMYARSSGSPSARNTLWIIGRYLAPRVRLSWM